MIRIYGQKILDDLKKRINRRAWRAKIVEDVKSVVLEVFRFLMIECPVASGLLRSAFRVQIGRPSSFIPSDKVGADIPKGQLVPEVLERAAKILERAFEVPEGSVQFVIENNVIYASFALEDGGPGQPAPLTITKAEKRAKELLAVLEEAA